MAEFTTTVFDRFLQNKANILFSLFLGEAVSAINFTSKDREL